ncbi:MAG TPA: FKBP-type peptidyl-prolyl cis-trans isomerase [Lacibacter sp.]|nr:FKBP-type peptidyl-prolyl cis-trans isomerase [Lacibacter sp.]
MKLFFCILLLLFSMFASAQVKKVFVIPDSLKISGFVTDITIRDVHPKKENKTGIRVDDIYLFIEAEKKEREIAMEFPEKAMVLAKGIDVEQDSDELEWNYNWQLNETYRLAVFTASDSASNFIMYSGYIYLPGSNKWKLIGCIQQNGRWGTVKRTETVSIGKHSFEQNQAWLQKTNGAWKNVLNSDPGLPIINPMSTIDSAAQATVENNYIQQLIKENKTDAVYKHEDVYYNIINQGSGRKVNVTDTVTVHYKGYLLSDGSVFDQTREKPVTFPLNRLIKGWQIGVPLLNVGGKIKIVIPSGLAYGIRTRSPKIPPNSSLVFEVEVMDAK